MLGQVFLRLWLGQWCSNLGTQISFYGLGLWVFTASGQFGALAAVALVVQLARIAALPLLVRLLEVWPRRGLLQLAYGVGGCVTAGLAGLLLVYGLRVPLPWVLSLLAIGAMAEAVLVVGFATLIPQLVTPNQLGRANGLFATTDGLVYLVAPFLGALLAARLGLIGVVLLDAASFLIALLCVSAGSWPAHVEVSVAPTHRSKPWQTTVNLHQRPRLWALLLLGMALMAGFAAAELLFPAWILAALGPDRLTAALLVSAGAYGLGMIIWQGMAQWPNHWPSVLVGGLSLQGVVLCGAALQWCEGTAWIWFLGVGAFNLAVPPVLAAQQSLWQRWVPQALQPAWFSARYGWEWFARLLAVVASGVLVDRLMQPLLIRLQVGWLGHGPGRPMAVALAVMGVLQLAVVAAHASVLLRRDERLGPCA